MSSHVSVFDGPLGPISVVTDSDGALLRLALHGVGRGSQDLPEGAATAAVGPGDDPAHQEIHAQLAAYFAGDLQEFDLPVRLQGPPFRRRVWQALRAPEQRAATPWVRELARQLGSPGAARAVGGACGTNPVPLVVPCHRVLASIGLGGWSAAPGLKEALLAHEGHDLSALS